MRKDAFKADEWALCPEEIPARVIRAAKKVFRNDASLAISRKRPSTGTCHLCGETVKAGKAYKYKWPCATHVKCPNCGKTVWTYYPDSARFWDSYFVANLATIERGTDGKSVFVRQWHVLRNADNAFNGPEQLRECARYAFRGDRIAKWTKEHRGVYFGYVYYDPLPEWKMAKDHKTWCYDDWFEMVFPDRRQMRRITRGTFCEHINAADYGQAMVKIRKSVNVLEFIGRYIRQPAYEKVTKAGYWRLAAEDYRCEVDWTAETVETAIGLPKWILRLKKPIDWESADIRKARLLRDLCEKGRISMADVTVAMDKLAKEQIELLEEVPNLKVGKMAKYAPDEYIVGKRIISGDYKLPKGNASPHDYADYIRQAKNLNLDLTNDRVLYPRDFKAAHARTTAATRYKANEALRGEFRKIVKQLKRYAWELDDLIIRPAASQEELIREGQRLHHCVGGYAERMAKGETEIFLIRRKANPKTPYFTLEYRNGHVVQCRTLDNETFAKVPVVRDFVTQWAATVRAAA